MSESLKLALRTFPDRIAELGFSAQLPIDWVSHPLPTDPPDFSDPTLFVPLAIVTAPHSALIFAFSARPAYDDGTLHDWAWYNLNHHKIKPRTVGPGIVGGIAAVVGEAIQDSDVGPMLIRFAFLEDGNRLLNLTLTVPEMLDASIRDAWKAMTDSFTLATPRGSRFKPEANADTTPAAPIPEPWLESKKPEQPAAAVTDPDEDSDPKSRPLFKKGARRFQDFALEADTTSLDQATTINANLRDRGAGLVPNIRDVDEARRCAKVAAGSITAFFEVPYGWHVIDDGRRTLVFEPSGRVQIHLHIIPREGRSNVEILDEIQASTTRDYPHPEFVRLKEGGIDVLGVRNIADGQQLLEQYHFLRPNRTDETVIRARLTTTPEESTGACNLTELILESMEFPGIESEEPPQPATPTESAKPTAPGNQPAWWTKALQLEAGGDLKGAEAAIKDGCQHMGFAASTADMYRLRMLRLKQAGDQKGALAAFKKADEFMSYYASMATSGGEGAALSEERDQFHDQLVQEFGSDPEK